MELLDLQEDLDGTACLDYLVRKVTWVPWDRLDLLEDQEAQEDLVLLDLKVNLDSQAETAHLVVLVVKEREVNPASRDPQEPACHHQSPREPKERQDYQVHLVFQVRKASLDSPVIPDFRDQMDVLDSPDHQVPREMLVSQEAQVVLEVQEQKAPWEKWDFQDQQARRVYQVSQVDLDLRDSQEGLVSLEPKVNQALLVLDRLDRVDPRENQASQGSQEVRDLKEVQEDLVSQVYQEGLEPKEILVCQDSKVLPVSLVPRVLMVDPVPQVSLELPVDQESLAGQEDQVYQERRVSQDGMGSQDQLESKESQAFLVMVVPVHLDFQGCQVQRETQVFPAHLAVLVSPALKERLVSLALLVLQATAALLGLRDWPCKGPKDFKDPLDHLEEQVDLAHRVRVDLQEVVALKERRVSPVLRACLASPDKKEILVPPESRVPPVFLAVPV